MSKRTRTNEGSGSEEAERAPLLRLSTELAASLGTRYCREEDILTLLLSHKVCTHVSTFEVKATMMGDLNQWMTITLDNDHASVADVKEGVERAQGVRPALQELFRYDDAWTGTVASGGSGHSAAQEDAAFIEEGVVFSGPCSVLVSVNELYDVVLEGREEGKPRQEMMGVYERMDGRELNGKGVWQALGGIERYLYFCKQTFVGEMYYGSWFVGDKEDMEQHEEGHGFMCVESKADTPDQIGSEETWTVGVGHEFEDAPEVTVRVCSSVEKYEALEKAGADEAQSLIKAQQVINPLHIRSTRSTHRFPFLSYSLPPSSYPSSHTPGKASGRRRLG
jgi:hypothetical protein